MSTDIAAEHVAQGRRVIIDTKFTEILTRTRWREGILKSAHLYQLYAYLRSQERALDPLSARAEGILLHPAVEADLDEAALIQGHVIRFRTLDLTRPTPEIAARLRGVLTDAELAPAGVAMA